MRPEARSAARTQAIKEGKEKRAAQESQKKADKAKSAAGAAKGQATGRYVTLYNYDDSLANTGIVLLASKPRRARNRSQSRRLAKWLICSNEWHISGTSRGWAFQMVDCANRSSGSS